MSTATVLGEMSALLIVDVQKDFISGALAVEGAETILPVVEHLIERGRWSMIVASQDYHPRSHISFASRHGLSPLDEIELRDADGQPFQQMLWPDHCVQHEPGSEIDERILRALSSSHWKDRHHIVQKGTNVQVDAYSAFAPFARGTADPDRPDDSPLAAYLHSHKIKSVYVVGLATDYCVAATARDAARLGFETIVISDACKAVDGKGGLSSARDTCQPVGVRFVRSSDDIVQRMLS
ncbi:uncharacterized protein L969DRAFT_92430 [Mixia osmundae IAM 14324]|uniref:nicotinamidase n=1 Tax=Mixia osmundae (strain CBS 9802 / IAM 14324 / JCM 22182 / KY 12970) TaxID=764103 RepID=G7DXK0_MIXOS|nr:uncharacterized protein L969DRAFT_92430 [Mixia osmundae IAM 14324]KEI41195.1 hypothetical protein L969DRAFT_92430 [Mixia osmundae IAM 14324]GAA95310.1 hypothetical protein E5Q_01967 [Mixia osmundae IAM 14324]